MSSVIAEQLREARAERRNIYADHRAERDRWRLLSKRDAAWPILKRDAASRLVTGIAAIEEVDTAGEIFDYASSAPLMRGWSAQMHSDTDGQSYGNIREMHSNIAAGRVESIEFDDENKAVIITAKIFDDSSWAKIENSVLTGFSIGGRYERKWPDVVNGKTVTRYTANPAEISLVDRPCMPSAKFTEVLKAVELRRASRLRKAQEGAHRATRDSRVALQKAARRRALRKMSGADIAENMFKDAARRQRRREAVASLTGELTAATLVALFGPVGTARLLHRPRMI